MPSTKVLPHQTLLSEIYFSQYNKNVSLTLDLVDIMSSIYLADIQITGNKRNNYIIEVPVENISLWTANKNLIEKLVKFVSEENFQIKFEETKKYSEPNLIPDLQEKKDAVTLFSGGLDSFSGAYQNYSTEICSDYIGFVNTKEEGSIQQKLRKFYNTTFTNSAIHIIDAQFGKKSNLTQSTRSLLYLSLGVAKAISNGSKKVNIYENGILTLNPELHGRYTTKTTHPKTLYLYNKLLTKAEIPVNIINPFIFNTKGEIINSMNLEFKKQIANTYTCGSGRSPGFSFKGQCGVCIPCLLRKISLASFDLEKFDVNYAHGYNIRVNDIEDKKARDLLITNIDYFIEYSESIQKQTIFNELEISSNYYNESDYYAQTYNMLAKFTKEFERFWSKYATY